MRKERTVQEKKTFIDKIWKFLASVKLAVFLIFLIAFTSIFGTVIEQNVSPEKTMMLLTKMFGADFAPTAFVIVEKLQLSDMYSSVWFLTILFIFAVNLIVCSLDRLPAIYRTASEPLKPLNPDSFGKFSIKKNFKLKGNMENAKNILQPFLGRLGFKLHTDRTIGQYQYFSQKGAKTRYAVYVIHLSIILIFIGAVIGELLGFDGYLNLPEGEKSAFAYTRDGEKHPLGFTIKCEDFNVSFYSHSDMPSEFVSWLSVIENGAKVIEAKHIKVNKPLQHKGYTFYQASYGPMSKADGLLVLRVTPKGGKPKIVSLKLNESFPIDGTKIVGTAVAFLPAITFDKEGKPYSYTMSMNQPAVLISFKENGEYKYGGWFAKRFPESWSLPDGNKVEFIDYYGYQYTGLQVRKDPGVWLVYLGCLFITLGLYAAFFLSHKKIWVNLADEKGKVDVKIAATSNKHRGGFESRLDSLLHKYVLK